MVHNNTTNQHTTPNVLAVMQASGHSRPQQGRRRAPAPILLLVLLAVHPSLPIHPAAGMDTNEKPCNEVNETSASIIVARLQAAPALSKSFSDAPCRDGFAHVSVRA